MGVYIPNMKSMFKTCGDCPLDVPNCRLWEELENINTERHPNCPLIEIDLVRCGECKHKPIKHDPEGDEYGFNLVSPNGYDNLCPCLNTDDGFYSYMPDDNFFCAFGERRE